MLDVLEAVANLGSAVERHGRRHDRSGRPDGDRRHLHADQRQRDRRHALDRGADRLQRHASAPTWPARADWSRRAPAAWCSPATMIMPAAPRCWEGTLLAAAVAVLPTGGSLAVGTGRPRSLVSAAVYPGAALASNVVITPTSAAQGSPRDESASRRSVMSMMAAHDQVLQAGVPSVAAADLPWMPGVRRRRTDRQAFPQTWRRRHPAWRMANQVERLEWSISQIMPGSGPHPACPDGESDWKATTCDSRKRKTPSSSPGW